MTLVEGEDMEYLILELFGPDGKLVKSADSRLFSTTLARIDTTLPSNGQYTVRVGQSGTKTGDYTLSLSK